MLPSMSHFGKSERSNVFDFHHTLNVWHVLFSADAHEGLAVETKMHTVFHRDSWIPWVNSIWSHRESMRILQVLSISHVQVLSDEVEFLECYFSSDFTIVLVDVRSTEFLRVLCDNVIDFVSVCPFRTEEGLIHRLLLSGTTGSIGMEHLRRS